MATLNMSEWLKTEGPLAPALRRGVVKKFAEGSSLLGGGAFPMETIGGPGLPFAKSNSLPTTAARAVGETYTASAGNVDPGYEPLKIYGGISTFDAFQVRTGSGNRRASEAEDFVEGLAKNFDRDFIKGDADTNPRVIQGLQNRLTGNQFYDPADGALTFTRLLEAKRRVSKATHIVCGDVMSNHFAIAAMDTTVGGYITRTKNEMGEEILRVAGLNMITMAEDATDTDIFPFTETGTTTSVYVLALGLDRCHGIQNQFPNAEDLGRNPANGVQYNTVIDWYVSFALEHTKSACRYGGITDAAITL